jgi:hypothetical protein
LADLDYAGRGPPATDPSLREAYDAAAADALVERVPALGAEPVGGAPVT